MTFTTTQLNSKLSQPKFSRLTLNPSTLKWLPYPPLKLEPNFGNKSFESAPAVFAQLILPAVTHLVLSMSLLPSRAGTRGRALGSLLVANSSTALALRVVSLPTAYPNESNKFVY